jgi:hypothetical protein
LLLKCAAILSKSLAVQMLHGVLHPWLLWVSTKEFVLPRLQDDGTLAAGLLVVPIVDKQPLWDPPGHRVAGDVAFCHTEVLSGQQDGQMAERGQAEQPRELPGSHG